MFHGNANIKAKKDAVGVGKAGAKFGNVSNN